ncbi:hypothetical protein ACFOZ7_09905 [Natribaculum luteum]|uniref:Uncharacterized protein n=1 Tax=Natribaculum luteum TaxID=1586232 RepID=A0ABD5NZU5_9EURY|nr:hypothetical protein [Natribaculum luteum]
MKRTTFWLTTLVAHLILAVGVAAHARVTDRDAGNWPYLTLAFGLFGVAGYVLGNR